ncbi:MAG: hypothetical protein AB7V56_08595 [Candidatus Nitrosocosmicus sp.]
MNPIVDLHGRSMDRFWTTYGLMNDCLWMGCGQQGLFVDGLWATGTVCGWVVGNRDCLWMGCGQQGLFVDGLWATGTVCGPSSSI